MSEKCNACHCEFDESLVIFTTIIYKGDSYYLTLCYWCNLNNNTAINILNNRYKEKLIVSI